MDIDKDQAVPTKSVLPAGILTSGLPDSAFVEGIRLGKREVLDSVYRHYFPKIKNLITKNSGTEDDARDVFQEALVAVYRNIQKPDFQLTCRFETYLHAIARNLWLLHLRNKKIVYTELGEAEDTVVEDLDETIRSSERYQLYARTFSKLGEQCQKLLTLYMQGVNMRSIAEELGFASEMYAKKRKFKCKEQLIAQIMQDEDYKRMTN